MGENLRASNDCKSNVAFILGGLMVKLLYMGNRLIQNQMGYVSVMRTYEVSICNPVDMDCV